MKQSGINEKTAYNIANEKFPDTSSYKLARKWLEKEIEK